MTVILGARVFSQNEAFTLEPQLGGVIAQSQLYVVFQAEKLMKQIGVKNVKLSEYEMSIAAHLVDPLSMQVVACFHKPKVFDRKSRPHDKCTCVCECR